MLPHQKILTRKFQPPQRCPAHSNRQEASVQFGNSNGCRQLLRQAPRDLRSYLRCPLSHSRNLPASRQWRVSPIPVRSRQAGRHHSNRHRASHRRRPRQNYPRNQFHQPMNLNPLPQKWRPPEAQACLPGAESLADRLVSVRFSVPDADSLTGLPAVQTGLRSSTSRTVSPVFQTTPAFRVVRDGRVVVVSQLPPTYCSASVPILRHQPARQDFRDQHRPPSPPPGWYRQLKPVLRDLFCFPL